MNKFKTIFKGVVAFTTLAVGFIDVYNFTRGHVCPVIKNYSNRRSGTTEDVVELQDAETITEE